MTHTLFISLLLITTGRSFSQDTAYQNKIEALNNKFSGHYDELTYKKLPKFISNHLERLYDENCSRTKELFTHSDAVSLRKRSVIGSEDQLTITCSLSAIRECPGITIPFLLKQTKTR